MGESLEAGVKWRCSQELLKSLTAGSRMEKSGKWNQKGEKHLEVLENRGLSNLKRELEYRKGRA